MKTLINILIREFNYRTNSKLFGVFLIYVLTPACVTTPVETEKQGIEIIEDYRVETSIKQEFNEAVQLLNQQKYDQAIILLKNITDTTKNFTAPYINLGMAYTKINKFEKAEDSFKKALKLNPDHPLAKNEMAVVYRNIGKFEEARKLYEEVLVMHPDFHPARKNLGVLCDLYLQDLNCAFKQYEIYLTAIPNEKIIKIWLADVKNRMK